MTRCTHGVPACLSRTRVLQRKLWAFRNHFELTVRYYRSMYIIFSYLVGVAQDSEEGKYAPKMTFFDSSFMYSTAGLEAADYEAVLTCRGCILPSCQL